MKPVGWTYGYFDHCSYRPEFGPPVGEYGEGEFHLIAFGEGVDVGSLNMVDGAFTIEMPGVISYGKK